MKTKSLLFFLLALSSLCSQTIEEKRSALLASQDRKELRTYVGELNKQLQELRSSIQERYHLASRYQDEEASEEEYKQLLSDVNAMRSEMDQLEQEWHDLAVNESKKDEEGYDLWDQEETSLSQLIMEYGSSDYLYVIPPEILAMKLHVHSALPIPRESWSDLLEVILSHNGIGVKQLNPYARQLYILKQDLVAVDQVLTHPKELALLPPKSRVAYVFSPPPERIKGVSQFFERFRDSKKTFIHQVGYKIAIISAKEEVEKLLSLYDAVWQKENEKQVSVVPISRLTPAEMEKVLTAYFGEVNKKVRPSLMQQQQQTEGEDLMMFPLKSESSIVLVGPKDMVECGTRVIKETENQIEDPKEMTVYWYTCRHSDPVAVSEILEKVYTSLIYSGVEGEQPRPQGSPIPPTRPLKPGQESPLNPPSYGPPPYSPVVQPLTSLSGTIEEQKKSSYTTNFIPDPKTGSVMMVVRRDTLDKIKGLIRKLDVPKKMVQIEVLLFEKKIKNHNNFGLNLLRLGSAASNTHETGASYRSGPIPEAEKKSGGRLFGAGIVDFFIFREKPNDFLPAFDLAYNFLISQEDVRLNEAPSVTTLNQTPATISLVDEISIDTGAAPITTNQGTAFQQSYARSQYGTTIVVTPTIHDPEDGGDDRHFVTIETNISFDTIKKNIGSNDRPTVSKRKLENQVRVVDGETVILGGLRSKTAEDTSSKLPFLGEVPGIGKFFGDSRMTDDEKEMFIFITPKIIFDLKGENDKLRCETLIKRPGDIPEFLVRIEEAKSRENKRHFRNSMKLLFGGVND